MQPPGKAWPAALPAPASWAPGPRSLPSQLCSPATSPEACRPHSKQELPHECLLGKGHLQKYLQMGPAGGRLTKCRDISVG